ncbi:hypothetical protein ACHAWF_010897 [Thalassiosira exigua]
MVWPSPPPSGAPPSSPSTVPLTRARDDQGDGDERTGGGRRIDDGCGPGPRVVNSHLAAPDAGPGPDPPTPTPEPTPSAPPIAISIESLDPDERDELFPYYGCLLGTYGGPLSSILEGPDLGSGGGGAALAPDAHRLSSSLTLPSSTATARASLERRGSAGRRRRVSDPGAFDDDRGREPLLVDFPRDDDESSEARGLPPRVFPEEMRCDDRGRCVRHPSVQLRRRRRPWSDEWVELISACPDCCLEEIDRIKVAGEIEALEGALKGMRLMKKRPTEETTEMGSAAGSDCEGGLIRNADDDDNDDLWTTVSLGSSSCDSDSDNDESLRTPHEEPTLSSPCQAKAA